MAAPILKWAGGKRQLISNILSLLPRNFRERTYHEPFFGGGALFFEIKPKSGSINDINTRLINFYKVVRDKPEKLIEQASNYMHEKETFYKLRVRFNEPGLSDVEEASLLLYLNKTAFNGLYRVNSKGKFNVPFGSYKNPTIVPIERINEASKVLKNIDIFNTDFTYILKYSKTGDLCYFDPPYMPISKTAHFTSYSSDGFDYKDQVRLRDTCKKLDEKGVLFVLSNSHIDEILELYNDVEEFRILTIQANRAISSKATTRGPINELLITNISSEISQAKGPSLTSFFED